MREHKESAEPKIDATAAAAAVALGRSARGEKQSPEAAGFLVAHRRLAELQMEHLHEERALHHRHLALKYFGDRLRVGLELLAVIFGLVLVTGLGVLTWRAHEDHGLVVEAFSVPPDLAQRGLTGQVVANRLLDKLADMQAQTASARPANTYANNWGSDLKVEIPRTGVSIGDAQRLLTQWLGHETHISGEVFHNSAALAVTARTEGAPARTFEGADADLDKLLQQSAETVYGATQPYRYAVFLAQHGRTAEAEPLLERLARGGSPADQFSAADYLSQEAMISGDIARVVAMSRLAIQADPTAGHPYWLEGVGESVLGHAEASLAALQQAVRLSSQSGGQFQKPELREMTLALARQPVAEDEGNWRDAAVKAAEIRAAAARIGAAEFSRMVAFFVVFRARDLASDHDIAAAQALIAGAGLPEAPGSGLDLGPAPAMRIERERAAEDWPALLSEMPYIVGDHATAGHTAAGFPAVRTAFAYGLAKVGRLADAETMEATLPQDCYDCVVDRGAIAAIKQDWPMAGHWFAEAVRQGPSLPFAYLEWGRMLLAKGDIAGAIHQFDLAHQKGPHFADPAELGGEALMRRRDFSGAVAKFEAADRDAPRWGRNHMLWGLALAAMGRQKEASAQYRAAGGMDLNAADRATLAGLLKSA